MHEGKWLRRFKKIVLGAIIGFLIIVAAIVIAYLWVSLGFWLWSWLGFGAFLQFVAYTAMVLGIILVIVW